ncbi:efflux RND transporter periplasmic adaptor subunit [Membranihabitans marinus]|uniref:efflux RND transporter periplasmic adaptor subunit n=1 Tax=Membranihabitans marinus TaxID=1227546 RepID=UPI001F441E16|nr:HlyD family efflux transporter periplasmic adaptor subunit [Membranihabitans marinus]
MKNNANIIRLITGIILGGLIIVGSILLSQQIVSAKEKPQTQVNKTITKTYAQTVKNSEIPIIIEEKGSLEALHKVELYSEVQGVLKTASKLFKPGQTYANGEVIMEIDDAEFNAGLIAQKSILYNLIAQVMPDLNLDYPEVFDKWNQYLNQFDIHKKVTSLPEFDNDKEKFFINSKNIVSTYYNIKNLEERHKKYTLRVPFHSIVTEAMVYPGTLIRSGQKLGSIINPSQYELAVSVNESYKDYLMIGKSVVLYNLEKTQSWKGRIARIDATVNTTTQGIKVYIEVSGKGLKEGMYLSAELEGRSIEQGYEVSRKLLVNNSQIYIIEDQKLKLIPVDVEYFKSKTAIISNLVDGSQLLENPIPGAYEGMIVEVINH